ncbi:flagellar basal body P-ring formation chaperone FlgA [Halomonas mongoliensis]|uniref:flagellar basal body P-ring formation chaperone FlgA n=1 Tax=Halomonas mongoliensis TaxID=321265 RepID=UPI00403A8EC6
MPSLRTLPCRLLLLSIWLVAAPAMAASDLHEELLHRVQAFLYEQAEADEVVIEVSPPSAHLPRCEHPEPFLPRSGAPAVGRVSVGVRCGAGGHQVRYLQAQIGVIASYPVAAVDLAPGSVLTEAHLELRHGNLAELPRQAVSDAAELVGQQARRSIRAGSPLQAQFFQARAVVERGQAVVVEAGGSSFRVTREGEALEPGALGESIRVRFGQREIIRARVIGNGRLAIDI